MQFGESEVSVWKLLKSLGFGFAEPGELYAPSRFADVKGRSIKKNEKFETGLEIWTTPARSWLARPRGILSDWCL